MNARQFFLAATLLALIPLSAQADDVVYYWVGNVRMTGEQYRQYQTEKAWREDQEQKRREAQAIALADQARERATRNQTLASLDAMNAEARAARAEVARVETARAEAARGAQLAAVHEADRAAAVAAAALARKNDVGEIERLARRHVRAAVVAAVKEGRLSRADALRRMSAPATPEREAIVADFKAGRIDKEEACARLADDDREHGLAESPAPAAPAAPAADPATARPRGDITLTAKRADADRWLATVFGGADKVPAIAKSLEYARAAGRLGAAASDEQNALVNAMLGESRARRVFSDEDRAYIRGKQAAMRAVMDALHRGEIDGENARTNLDALMADIKAM